MQAPPGGGSPRPTAHDRQKNFLHLTESVIRCEVRFGYCTTNQAPLAELIAETDETMSSQ